MLTCDWTAIDEDQRVEQVMTRVFQQKLRHKRSAERDDWNSLVES